MKIEKAIEILTIFFINKRKVPDDDIWDASKLGLEALKQVKESRFDPSTWEPKLLPGETEE